MVSPSLPASAVHSLICKAVLMRRRHARPLLSGCVFSLKNRWGQPRTGSSPVFGTRLGRAKTPLGQASPAVSGSQSCSQRSGFWFWALRAKGETACEACRQWLKGLASARRRPLRHFNVCRGRALQVSAAQGRPAAESPWRGRHRAPPPCTLRYHLFAELSPRQAAALLDEGREV